MYKKKKKKRKKRKKERKKRKKERKGKKRKKERKRISLKLNGHKWKGFRSPSMEMEIKKVSPFIIYMYIYRAQYRRYFLILNQI